jgi:hypothetical protein
MFVLSGVVLDCQAKMFKKPQESAGWGVLGIFGIGVMRVLKMADFRGVQRKRGVVGLKIKIVYKKFLIIICFYEKIAKNCEFVVVGGA